MDNTPYEKAIDEAGYKVTPELVEALKMAHQQQLGPKLIDAVFRQIRRTPKPAKKAPAQNP